MRREAGCGVTVLVADSDADSRGSIVAPLERIGCTPYEAASGHEALVLSEKVRPTLVIIDVSLPGITGYEVCHELRDRFGADILVMFVSGARVEPLDRVAGLLIGADDYVVKPFDPDELLGRVRALLRRHGGHHNRHERSEDGDSPLATLTPREREVLARLAQGRTQHEIAESLVISPTTVATHIQRILGKLGVHSRAQAVALAFKQGLVEPDAQAHSLEVALLAD